MYFVSNVTEGSLYFAFAFAFLVVIAKGDLLLPLPVLLFVIPQGSAIAVVCSSSGRRQTKLVD
jgi:hypothetical protein